MKTATILPQAYLNLIADRPYHMALAHLIQKPGFEEYTRFYMHMGLVPDKFLMMDTGLIEGDARPIDELIEKARLLNADEMAIPDVFMDAEETLVSSYNALEYLAGTDLEIRKMVIPQGTSLAEWIECAKVMLQWNDVDTIGVPKVLTHLSGRDARIKAVQAIQDQLGDKEIHLLGCYESPLELKIYENVVRSGNVVPARGCDSAIAYAYARKGVRITDDERPEGKIFFGAQDADLDVLKYNIDIWESEAKELPHYVDATNEKIVRIK